MVAKERRLTAKGILQKVCGKDICRNHISPADKVAIMEYLFSCTMEEVVKYKDNGLPAFVVSCSRLLANNQLSEYLDILQTCRKMAKESGAANKTKTKV